MLQRLPHRRGSRFSARASETSSPTPTQAPTPNTNSAPTSGPSPTPTATLAQIQKVIADRCTIRIQHRRQGSQHLCATRGVAQGARPTSKPERGNARDQMATAIGRGCRQEENIKPLDTKGGRPRVSGRAHKAEGWRTISQGPNPKAECQRPRTGRPKTIGERRIPKAKGSRKVKAQRTKGEMRNAKDEWPKFERPTLKV